MYWIMEFCMESSLALDNWTQKYCQTLGKLISQTIHTTCYCCRDDYFTKRKFKDLIVCFTQCTLFFQKDCCLLQICLPCVIWGSYARDHGMLRDFFFCARQLRAKILSYSWQLAKPFTPCAVTTIIFQRKILNYLIVCFPQCALFFQKVGFLLPICLPYVICGSYETKINVVLWRSARQTFASLGSLRSHVLRAYCNFESKEANSTTLFGPHPNDKIEWRNHSL